MIPTSEKHAPAQPADPYRIPWRAGWTLLGLGVLAGVWALIGVALDARFPADDAAGLGPRYALPALWALLLDGVLIEHALPSILRVVAGLALAAAIGVPIGLLIGAHSALRQMAGFPFQFLRMISPLAWLPIAALMFVSWDGVLIFLIVMASVWPILFSTAFSMQRVDPLYVDVARNFGAPPLTRLRHLVLPAVAPDALAGVRLALGISWVVLIPAEHWGVGEGLGTLMHAPGDPIAYDVLAALLVLVGVIGYALDTAVVGLIRWAQWG